MQNDWSSKQYTKFEEERTRPVRDLLAQVRHDGAKTAIDLGCGPGNSTEELLRRFPDADISGIDNSPDMIAAAKARLPALSFDIADLNNWQGGARYDVILSNAVIQWLPNHDVLLPHFMSRLVPDGVLAIQIPANLKEPVQTLMRSVAAEGPWKDKLSKSEGRYDRYDANWYYSLLQGHASKVDIWQTTYYHVLDGAAAIVEWFKGSGLRPFLGPLDEAERAEYLRLYEAEVAKAYPAMPDGKVLMAMPRLFIVATK